MDKQALVDYLRGLQADMESRFSKDVCENWSLEGFLEHIDNCIGDITNEIDAELEDDEE